MKDKAVKKHKCHSERRTKSAVEESYGAESWKKKRKYNFISPGKK